MQVSPTRCGRQREQMEHLLGSVVVDLRTTVAAFRLGLETGDLSLAKRLFELPEDEL
jgi:hypothetical protein